MRTQVQSPARTCRFEVLESRRVLAVGIGLSGVHGPPAVRSIVAPAPAPTSAAVLGDFNLDGRLSANDLTAALSALTDISGYVAAHQLSENDLLAIGDINHDYDPLTGNGGVNNFDLQPLIILIANNDNPPPPPPPPTAANVTASLSGTGVLTVSGSAVSDSIAFVQTGGNISITGVSGSWQATKVKSIVVNLQTGGTPGDNDYVYVDSLADGGTQVLQEQITLNSGSGADDALLIGGHHAIFSGLGHVLVVAANGSATLDGQLLTWPDPPPTSPDPTWFDTNTQDPTIRSVGHQEFQDQLMDRTDMINLLRAVEQTGPVTSTEMSDLTKIVNTAALFGNLGYVQQLAQNIVLGNVANAHYQGATLGNLAVGSGATQLEELVDKWFLGLDHPAANGGYSTASGPLFLDGAAYTDIAQGGLGDCGLVSTFAEVALRRPDIITGMFIVNGDSTYTVRFYQGTAARYVTVDSQLPGGYASVANELWVGLAEKAYAQINEEGWLDASTNGQNAYWAIAGTYIHDAQAQITGLSTVNFSSVSTSFSTFASLVAAGKMIGFASVSSPPVGGVIGNHAYAVISCDTTAQTVTLYNPWGVGVGNGGLVTLTWPQIQADFMYFERTV